MDIKSIKTMILGIIIMLFGESLFTASTGTFGTIALLIVVLGLIIGIIGFFQKD